MTPRPKRPSRASQVLLFARNFIKHPTMLGAPAPSSRFVVSRVLGTVDWATARTVVEYGPGLGTITGGILDRLHPDATLVVIETNADFVDYLRKWFDDPRLRVVQGSAADVQKHLADLKLPAADVVVSGIPFSWLPDGVRRQVVDSTRDVLAPEGLFVVYQVRDAVLPELKRVFPRVEHRLEPRNLLPMHIYLSRK